MDDFLYLLFLTYSNFLQETFIAYGVLSHLEHKSLVKFSCYPLSLLVMKFMDFLKTL